MNSTPTVPNYIMQHQHYSNTSNQQVRSTMSPHHKISPSSGYMHPIFWCLAWEYVHTNKLKGAYDYSVDVLLSKLERRHLDMTVWILKEVQFWGMTRCWTLNYGSCSINITERTDWWQIQWLFTHIVALCILSPTENLWKLPLNYIFRSYVCKLHSVAAADLMRVLAQ